MLQRPLRSIESPNEADLDKFVGKIVSRLRDDANDLFDQLLQAPASKYFHTVPTPSQPFCFVIMSFAPSGDDIYELGIKAAIEANHLLSHRIDENLLSQPFMNKVYSCIRSAQLVVTDLTELRPNVLYELGIAHALNKQVVLICDKAHKLPSDLGHLNTHFYETGKLSALKKHLTAAISQHVSRANSRRKSRNKASR